MNFWILPADVFGTTPNTTPVRHFEASELSTAVLDDLLFAHLRAVLQFDERAGRLAPRRIRLGDDGRGENRGVAIEHVLDFDRGDILASGNDDVLGAALHLYVTIWLQHSQIAFSRLIKLLMT